MKHVKRKPVEAWIDDEELVATCVLPDRPAFISRVVEAMITGVPEPAKSIKSTVRDRPISIQLLNLDTWIRRAHNGTSVPMSSLFLVATGETAVLEAACRAVNNGRICGSHDEHEIERAHELQLRLMTEGCTFRVDVNTPDVRYIVRDLSTELAAEGCSISNVSARLVGERFVWNSTVLAPDVNTQRRVKLSLLALKMRRRFDVMDVSDVIWNLRAAA